MREIGRFKADLPENMWHLTQQTQRLLIGLLQVNTETVKRYDSVVDEAAAPLRERRLHLNHPQHFDLIESLCL